MDPYIRTVYRICLYIALLGKNLFRFHETRPILHVENSKVRLFKIINLQTILTDAARISILEAIPETIPLALSLGLLDVVFQTLLSPKNTIYRPPPKNPTNRPRCYEKDPFPKDDEVGRNSFYKNLLTNLWPIGRRPSSDNPRRIFGDKIVPTRRTFAHSGIAPGRKIRFRESFYPPSKRFVLSRNPPSERSVGRDLPSDVTKPDNKLTVWKPFFVGSLSINSVAERPS